VSIQQWLKVGIAIYLAFTAPKVDVTADGVTVTVALEHLLTEEMEDLLHHGVSFEYELYCSLRARPKDPTEKAGLMIVRVSRILSYDYLEGAYSIAENGGAPVTFRAKEEMREASRTYTGIRFSADTERYKDFSLFAQVRLRENPLIEDTLGMSTGDLWAGFSPSMEVGFAHEGIR
jgi:hypothetical protein